MLLSLSAKTRLLINFQGKGTSVDIYATVGECPVGECPVGKMIVRELSFRIRKVVSSIRHRGVDKTDIFACHRA